MNSAESNPPIATEPLWFYYAAEKKEAIGPVPFSELQRLATAGVVTPETLIVENGGSEWQRFAAFVFPSPTPPPLPKEPLWFYADSQNKSCGPIPFSELQKLAIAGIIRPESQVFEKGGTTWQRFDHIGIAKSGQSSSAKNKGCLVIVCSILCAFAFLLLLATPFPKPILLGVLVLYPIGLFLLWRRKAFQRRARAELVLAAVFFPIFLNALHSIMPDNPSEQMAVAPAARTVPQPSLAENSPPQQEITPQSPVTKTAGFGGAVEAFSAAFNLNAASFGYSDKFQIGDVETVRGEAGKKDSIVVKFSGGSSLYGTLDRTSKYIDHLVVIAPLRSETEIADATGLAILVLGTLDPSTDSRERGEVVMALFLRAMERKNEAFAREAGPLKLEATVFEDSKKMLFGISPR